MKPKKKAPAPTPQAKPKPTKDTTPPVKSKPKAKEPVAGKPGKPVFKVKMQDMEVIEMSAARFDIEYEGIFDNFLALVSSTK